jgi:hypothetical protein
MIDPTMHAMAWRLARQDERERRAAERNLGTLVARFHRFHWWRRPETAPPKTANTETARPNTTHTETARPNTTHTETTHTETAQPETAQPETAQPETAQPETAARRRH